MTPWRCAGAEEQFDELEVVPLRRPVERGETVRFGRVDVDLLCQQGVDRLHVLLLDGLDQWMIPAAAIDTVPARHPMVTRWTQSRNLICSSAYGGNITPYLNVL